MAKRYDETETWQQYLDGIDYNQRINLYETNNKNERFYSGDQWNGVQANGLPTPVFNMFKRIINYFIAAILSENTAIQFTPENVGDEPSNEDEQDIKEAAELVTQYSLTLFEKLKMNQKTRQWLLDSALTGDMCAYNFWDASIDTMQDVKGDIGLEEIDSVNVMFGNPNDKRTQPQPYIIIPLRELVANVKKEAKENGIHEDEIKKITFDTEYEYQAGDRSKIELEQKNTEMNGKCLVLLKLWKKDGKVYAKKCTRYTDVRPEWDTKLTLYPIAWGNWDVRKNSYHGQAVGTGLVPNQIYINKMFAMAMISTMNTAYPKALYNKDRIAGWDNTVGSSIGVSGLDPSMSINNLATYMDPGKMSNDVFKLIDLAIQYTKDTLGATDAALGDIKADNTSAIIAVQQASAIPLETIKQNMYQFIEDIGYIWLDFMANHYGKRSVDVEVMGKRVIKEFDFAKLKKMKFRIKIDVGPSSYWSQIATMQTLDNLLTADRITFLEYLERLPAGMVTQKNELIESRKQEDIKQQFIYEQMARFLETLPPEIQAQIQELPPEEQESQLMEMMMQPPEEAQQQQGEQQAQQEQQMMQQQQAEQMAKQEEAQKGETDFQRQLQMKEMEINGKMAIESMKGGR